MTVTNLLTILSLRTSTYPSCPLRRDQLSLSDLKKYSSSPSSKLLFRRIHVSLSISLRGGLMAMEASIGPPNTSCSTSAGVKGPRTSSYLLPDSFPAAFIILRTSATLSVDSRPSPRRQLAIEHANRASNTPQELRPMTRACLHTAAKSAQCVIIPQSFSVS